MRRPPATRRHVPDGKLPYCRGGVQPGDYPADNESPNSLFPLINFGWNAQRLPHHFCVYAAEFFNASS